MVVSEIIYPGWKVLIDGKEGDIIPAHQVLRSVQIPPGDHIVEFIYQPNLYFLGLLLAAIGWIIILWKEVIKKIYVGTLINFVVK